jgi:hypothetical protein
LSRLNSEVERNESRGQHKSAKRVLIYPDPWVTQKPPLATAFTGQHDISGHIHSRTFLYNAIIVLCFRGGGWQERIMKTPKHSLRKIVSFLNNPDEDGGFWLPNIQRAFVWSEEQTCRLFDSILREYPISTLLIWKTKSKIRRRKFIDNFQPHHRIRLSDFYVPEDDRRKCLVLDGQQRLQSLFIGLKGSYAGRELFLDVLSGEVAAPDDVKYKFAFLDPSSISFPWIR